MGHGRAEGVADEYEMLAVKQRRIRYQPQVDQECAMRIYAHAGGLMVLVEQRNVTIKKESDHEARFEALPAQLKWLALCDRLRIYKRERRVSAVRVRRDAALLRVIAVSAGSERAGGSRRREPLETERRDKQ